MEQISVVQCFHSHPRLAEVEPKSGIFLRNPIGFHRLIERLCSDSFRVARRTFVQTCVKHSARFLHVLHLSPSASSWEPVELYPQALAPSVIKNLLFPLCHWSFEHLLQSTDVFISKVPLLDQDPLLSPHPHTASVPAWICKIHNSGYIGGSCHAVIWCCKMLQAHLGKGRQQKARVK